MPNEQIIPESEINAVIEPLIDNLRKNFSSRSVEYAAFILHTHVYFEIVPVYLQLHLIHRIIEVIEKEFQNKMPNYVVDQKRIIKKLTQFYNLYNEFPTVYDTNHVNRISIGPLLRKTAEVNTLYNEIKIAQHQQITTHNAFTETQHSANVEEINKVALIENTIDEYLENFKDTVINNKDYPFILKTLCTFFEGNNPTVYKTYFVKHGSNLKLGFELGAIFKSLKNEPISFEYLQLCKQLFDCYKDIEIEENNRFNNRLYKYLTKKTQ